MQFIVDQYPTCFVNLFYSLNFNNDVALTVTLSQLGDVNHIQTKRLKISIKKNRLKDVSVFPTKFKIGLGW